MHDTTLIPKTEYQKIKGNDLKSNVLANLGHQLMICKEIEWPLSAEKYFWKVDKEDFETTASIVVYHIMNQTCIW